MRIIDLIISIILMVISLVAIAGLIILMLYIYNTYGNMPIDEVPSWVHWLMW